MEQQIITGIYAETKPNEKNLVNVNVNGFAYKYDTATRFLWDLELKHFARPQHITENELQQINNQIKYGN